MPVENVIFYPDDSILTGEAQRVEEFGPELSTLVENLRDTMVAYHGLGIAAPQIGVSQRVFIVNLAAARNPNSDDVEVLVFVNPTIEATYGEDDFVEGCLSIPGITERVKRSTYIKMRALDENGEPFVHEATGYEAAALQHELDHLDGKLFLDRLSQLKRNRALKRYRKFRRQRGI